MYICKWNGWRVPGDMISLSLAKGVNPGKGKV